MVSALGQADSFNSSGATIVPDRNADGSVRYNTRGRASGGASRDMGLGNGVAPTGVAQTLRGVPSLVAQARMLMPEDSFGRELDAMVNAQAHEGHGDQQEWLFDREGTAPPGDGLISASQSVNELSFSQILNVPSSPSDEPAEPPSNSDADFASQIEAYLRANNYTPDVSATNNAPPNFETLRPASAQSHTTSEYSFSSTDVDTDSVMSDSNPVLQPTHEHASDLGFGGINLGVGASTSSPHHFWVNANPTQTDQGGTHPQGIKRESGWERSRTVAPDSLSPPDLASSGAQQGGGLVSEDESARNARLEHRRHINRKSAQKHRKRRKEELEVLTQRVADRDIRISQLERDLAVEKAKSAQMLSFIKSNGVKIGAEGGS